MTLISDPEDSLTLSEQIKKLECSDLENIIPDKFDLVEVFNVNEQDYFFIQGLANFWNQSPGFGLIEHMTDLVQAAHNSQQDSLTFILSGTPEKCALSISLGSKGTTKSLLEGSLPGIELHPEVISACKVADSLQPHFQTKGIVTGIPSLRFFKSVESSDGIKLRAHEHSVLDRIIHSMHGATWAYIVQACPFPRDQTSEQRLGTIGQLETLSSPVRNLSREFDGKPSNYRKQYLERLLKRELDRLEQASATGQWAVKTYFGASTFDDAQRLASVLKGTLTGEQSRPQPIRAILCRNGGDLGVDPKALLGGTENSSLDFSTLLSSHELARLIQLPREEVAGYAIHDAVRFDVDFRTVDTDTLVLGNIRHNEQNTQNTFNITLNDLTKHCVVVGVTGSGKTTTIMNLLDRLVEVSKPFLVIEPAKTEYRALLTPLAEKVNMRIYTLGDERIAPFRLNPLEFETDEDPESASLLSHIDFLKAVFAAAFALWDPMPQILEEALHEIYEDKGWNLASGHNALVPNWADRHKYPIFPTLTDLYRKVAVVTKRKKYHHEVESNIMAALEVRIGSLRLGSKGLMLDTSRGIPMKELLSTPTILEMENIGNDDEKTFLLGLFLAKLYEYRRLQATDGTLQQGLQHLIIFEEAHRLLKKTSTQVGVEDVNPRAQAIEVFTNMLSEIRAYGQGVLVAEQIPSKLAPDVLKNTNLKIVHRLIAWDDRRAVGGTMNLKEDQMVRLGVLAPGEAVVYAEGVDHAYLVQLDNYQRKLTKLKNSELRERSSAYASVKPYQAILDMDRYDIPLSQFGMPNEELSSVINKLLDTEKNKRLWAMIFLRICHNPSKILEMLFRFSDQIEAEAPRIQQNKRDLALRMMLVQGCATRLSERGAMFGWTYPQIEELRVPLTQGLIKLVQTHDLGRASSDLKDFLSIYKEQSKRAQGPFPGCECCKVRCMYRFDTDILLTFKNVEWITEELSSDAHKTELERYASTAQAAKYIGASWLGDQPGGPLNPGSTDIGYCSALTVINVKRSSDYNEYEQLLLAEKFQPAFM